MVKCKVKVINFINSRCLKPLTFQNTLHFLQRKQLCGQPQQFRILSPFINQICDLRQPGFSESKGQTVRVQQCKVQSDLFSIIEVVAKTDQTPTPEDYIFYFYGHIFNFLHALPVFQLLLLVREVLKDGILIFCTFPAVMGSQPGGLLIHGMKWLHVDDHLMVQNY